MGRRHFLGSVAAVAGSALATDAVSAATAEDEQQVRNLIDQMSVEEKVQFTYGHDGPATGNIPGLDRLGIPDILMADGPVGVRSGESTAFPATIGAGSTFDPDLIYDEGLALGSETKANDRDCLLAPALNICRVPLNGRTFEYYGEDPLHSGELAAANAQGIQDEGIVACAKHFVANNQEINRMSVSAEVDERTLREIYFPGFRKTVREGGVLSVMGAYNRVNGTHCTENEFLLNEVLKGDWGFEYHELSDWGATHSTAFAANAGHDLDMYGGQYENYLLDAVQNGDVSEARLDDMVFRVLLSYAVTGHLDGDKAGGPGEQNTAAHQDLARTIAEEGAVLLKNEGDLLPLDPAAIDSLAVIGSRADEAYVGGGGSSEVASPYTVDPLSQIENYVGSSVDVTYEPSQDPGAAGDAAAAADVALVFAEEGATEGWDRESLALPGGQNDTIQAAADANPSTVAVLRTPGPVTMPWEAAVPAVLEMWFPGMEDGTATANLLFGETNPSGKLPVTFGRTFEDYPATSYRRYPDDQNATQAHYDEGVYVGYRWFDEQGIEPLFPFGHGESYTDFEYSNLQVPDSTTADSTATVSVDVTNVGDREGSEVVQLYVQDLAASVDRPPKELKGFAKPTLAPGETQTVTIELDREAFEFWHPDQGAWVVEDGDFQILVGSSSRDVRVQDALTVSGDGGSDPDTEAPTAPGDLAVSSTTSSSLSVDWSASTDTGGSGLSHYVVSVDGANDQQVQAGTTTATVSGLAADTSYTVGVTAVDGAGNASTTATVQGTTDPADGGGDVVWSVNAGGDAYTAPDGTAFGADGDVTGGSTATTTNAIANTDADPLYQSERWGEFTYEVPVDAGTYDVELHFAEFYWTEDGARVFDVLVEGQEVVSDLDVHAEVGANAAMVETVTGVSPSDGTLTIEFVTEVDNAKVSAIAVTGDGSDDGGSGGEPDLPQSVSAVDYVDSQGDFDTESNGEGGQSVGWIDAGDWWEFDAPIENGGSVDLTVRASSPYDGTAFRVEVDGQDVSGTAEVPNTGEWHAWTTVTAATGVQVDADSTVRVVAETGSWNFDALGLE